MNSPSEDDYLVQNDDMQFAQPITPIIRSVRELKGAIAGMWRYATFTDDELLQLIRGWYQLRPSYNTGNLVCGLFSETTKIPQEELVRMIYCWCVQSESPNTALKDLVESLSKKQSSICDGRIFRWNFNVELDKEVEVMERPTLISHKIESGMKTQTPQSQPAIQFPPSRPEPVDGGVIMDSHGSFTIIDDRSPPPPRVQRRPGNVANSGDFADTMRRLREESSRRSNPDDDITDELFRNDDDDDDDGNENK